MEFLRKSPALQVGIFLCERKACYLRQGQQSQNPSLAVKQIHQHDTCLDIQTQTLAEQNEELGIPGKWCDQKALPSSLDRKNISLLYCTKKMFQKEVCIFLLLLKG